MTTPEQSWQQPGAPPAQPPVGTVRNGMGVAALVLGLFAVLLCWTVLGGIVLGILAIAFGFVGRSRANRGEATNRIQAMAGIVLGAIGLVLAIVLVAAGLTFFAHHKSQIQKLNNCLKNAHTQSAQQQCENKYPLLGH